MSESQEIRLIIAGSDAALRHSLSTAINMTGHLRLVGEAENGREAVELCEMVRPHVVLMDLDLPHSEGVTATRAIRQRWPEIKVIILVGSNADVRLQFTRQVGAVDHLLKPAAPESLVEALSRMQELISGQAHLQPAELPAKTSFSQRTRKELQMAGRVQSGILPDHPPTVPGWDIAARLIAAHETTGDFYDFIPLSNGKWGLVIADVTDKGLGAAVFMAMCSTLIRTYADRYNTLPAIAISSVNERILKDTRGSLYVTVFFGILEPELGRLRYVNAGHNPPIVLSSLRGKASDRLQRTGIALGVSDEASWQQKIVKFTSGDVLVLYTDGVTEAQDPQGRFFGEQRLLESVRTRQGQAAQAVLDSVLADLDHFTQGVKLDDDTTLIVVVRK